MFKKIILLSLIFAQFQGLVFGQKNLKVTFEEIKEQCKSVPLQKRLRVTVPRFSVTTSNAPMEFGGNLATMLTNALQQVNCYRVLESLRNSEDMDEEIKRGETRYANRKTTPKVGKQFGAQLVITGEVTEYSVKNKGLGIGLLKLGSNKASIGFILKMVNPETREVLFSKSINVESKASGTASFGLFGANLVSTQNSDPAVANACEQGIIQAVEFLSSKKDILELPQIDTDKTNTTATTLTDINVTNANFNAFTIIATLISKIPTYKEMEKSLDNGTANFSVTHQGTAENFLNELSKKIGNKYQIIGFKDGIIELKVN